MKKKKWTTIYDDGNEEVLIHAKHDGSLEWEYRDLAGSLEEVCWQKDMETDRIFDWLASHKIDAATFDKGEYSALWEETLASCRNARIGDLVDEIRQRQFLRV